MTLNRQQAITLIKKADKLKSEISNLKAKVEKVEDIYRKVKISMQKIENGSVMDFLSPSILRKSLQTLEESDSNEITIPNHYDLAVLVKDLPEVLDSVMQLKSLLKNF